MKVVCESCHTRYAIADEKVRGKSLKVKCKKCGAYMVVRSPEAQRGEEEPHEEVKASDIEHESPLVAAAATTTEDPEEKETRVFNYAEFERLMADKGDEGTPAAVVPSAARPQAVETPEWYLLVGEEQLGPLSRSDVEERIRRSVVDGDTYAWREGLADWRPLREIDELATLLSTVPVVSEEPTRAERPASLGAGPASADPFSAAADLAVAPSLAASPAPEPEPEPAEKKLTGQRHEDSVLFSLKNLGVVSFEGKEGGPRVVVEPPPGRSRDSSLSSIAGKETWLSVSAGAAAEVPLPPPILVPPARRGLSVGAKVGLILGSVVVVAGAAVGVVLVSRDWGKAPPPSVAAPVAPAPPAPPAAAPAPPTPLAMPTQPSRATTLPGSALAVVATPDAGATAAVVEEEEEEVVDEGGRRRKVRRKKRSTPQAEEGTRLAAGPSAPPEGVRVTRETLREETERESPPPTTPSAPPTPKAADSEIKAILEGKGGAPPSAPSTAAAPQDEGLPETLEKSAVSRVIRRNMSGVIRCYNTKVSDKATKKGTLNVSFTIKRNGRTAGIRVARPDFWGADFVGCIGGALKRWKFPRFKGEEIDITYPFILGGF